MSSSHQPVSGIKLSQRIEELMPAVSRIARRASRGLEGLVDRDDLVAAGQLGLAQAVRRVGREGDTHFKGYALTRIKGAIRDEIRRADSLTRLERIDVCRFKNEETKLRSQLGRDPEDHEIAKRLGLSETEYLDRRNRVCRHEQVPVDTVGGGELPRGIELADKRGLDIDESIDMARSYGEVRRAMSALSPRHERVLELFYLHGATLVEIGDELGVSESRVSQIRKEAVDTVRRELVGACDPKRGRRGSKARRRSAATTRLPATRRSRR